MLRFNWLLLLCFWLLVSFAMACIPSTDLTREHGGASGGGDIPRVAGASLVDPAAGAADVPRNLAAIWMKFPRPVSAPEGAITATTDGTAAALGPPVFEPCPDGSDGVCLKLPLVEPLRPAAIYVVTLGKGVVDGDGVDVPTGVVGQFVTAADVDLVAPSIDALSIQPSGPCALIAFVTDEPAQAVVRIEGATQTQRISGGAGTTQFSLAVSLAEFPADSALGIVVEVQDRAGNRSESPAVGLTVPAGLVPLAITEVHANPAGTEPTQEFVEIRNLGAQPIDLSGIAIADAKGMDALPPATLDAGGYALVVASGFDPAGPKDTPPSPGTPLLRVDSRIGSDGLSNGGEAVRLLSQQGTVISSYSAAIDVSASGWSGQSVHRLPEAACDQDASWTRHPAAATPGWAAP